MEYERKRSLVEIAPLLEQLDRGEMLSADERAELEAVKELYCDGWKGTLPVSIGTLNGLESLSLWGSLVSDLSPLSSLTALQHLDLSYTDVEDLSPLCCLYSLKELLLLEVPDTDLTPLSNLTALKSLNLWETQVSDLTALSNLSFLKKLYLCRTKVSNIAPLSTLSELEVLNLDDTQVVDILPLSGLNKLKELRISSTKITSLSFAKGFSGLKRLALNGMVINNLHFLSELPQLEAVELCFCKIRNIPQELFERGLRFELSSGCMMSGWVWLYESSLSTQPISIFGESREVVGAYFNSIKIPVRESKVIFLGDGGAGKTHTIKRMLNKSQDEEIDTRTTLGISINRFAAEGKNGKFDINFWDFGGQENMHAMHRCFLTERTLYVVVINNRWNLDQQARYWLDNIRSFAPDSPVILAVNLWENIQQYGLDTNRLQRDYPNLKWIARYAAKGGEQADFDALTRHIIAQAEELDSCAMELPEDWAAIRQELIDMAQSDEWYLDREKYHEICERHGLGEDRNEIRTWLLEWFNDLGVCFSYHRNKQTKEELGTYKVLNPRWLTSAIYILLNATKKYYQNGIMHLGSIEALLENPSPKKLERKDDCDYILDGVSYEEEECQYILEVMRKFGLSYRINENAEFIPALCDSEMPKDLHPVGYGKPVSYEFRYSFLPDSVVQRLMIRLYGSKTFTKLWRRGFRFDDPDHGLITVVDAGGPDDTLRIDVYSSKENKGRDVMAGLITNIAAVNTELNLKPEQYIIVHGDRGEIPTPADMILQAKEKNIGTIHLYSKESGLTERNVDEILGYTYGPKLIEAAQEVAKGHKTGLSQTLPQVINNYYIYGSIYNSTAPESLLTLLERMADQNIQVSHRFTEYLLEQLRDSGDDDAESLAENVEKNKEDGVLKTLWKGVKGLPKLATGAKTVLVDGKAAYEAAKPIIDIIKAAFITYGPQITEGLMEGLKLLPPG